MILIILLLGLVLVVALLWSITPNGDTERYDPMSEPPMAINWRWFHTKKLVSYIQSAEGADHDAIVFSTGYEFDPSDLDAVRFVTAIVMSQASHAMGPRHVCGELHAGGREDSGIFYTEGVSYEYAYKGEIHGLCRLGDATENEVLLRLMDERSRREDELGPVQASTEYSALVKNAVCYVIISPECYTKEEAAVADEFEKRLERYDRISNINIVVAKLSFWIMMLLGITAIFGKDQDYLLLGSGLPVLVIHPYTYIYKRVAMTSIRERTHREWSKAYRKNIERDIGIYGANSNTEV